MGWRGTCAVLQRLSQKLATLAPTPNPSRLREGKVLNWPVPAPDRPTFYFRGILRALAR
ncbi:hypothetical protein GCM10019071_01020 [Sphingobium fuliginis]|uniref:Uncharacterized protein n=1 Tax=Sphingobium fuliginis (strain ATCC 27551) TaxID=336203 RepID=A0ABQ1EL56_SPHSA|nr:hypothetical protein GCM10019071_01020 [Sphingobium fuliginis]